MAHRRHRTDKPLQMPQAIDPSEILVALGAAMQGTATFTQDLMVRFGKTAGRKLVETLSELARWLQSSSAKGRGLRSTISDWFKGANTDEFGMDPTFLEAIRPIFQFLYRDYFRVDVKGTKWLPKVGPALLVANHSGALPYDGAMLSLAVFNNHPLKRDVRFLVDDFVLPLPILRTAIERAGGIRASQENATRLLKAGHLVAAFPEGLKGVGKPYEQRYHLQRFGRGGFVRLAMRTGVPIIPVGIVGAEEVHPVIWKSERLGKPIGMPYVPFTPTFPWLGPLGLVPMPVKWKIFFGEPIEFASFTPADAEDEKLVTRRADAVKHEVRQLVRQALAERTSMWMD